DGQRRLWTGYGATDVGHRQAGQRQGAQVDQRVVVVDQLAGIEEAVTVAIVVHATGDQHHETLVRRGDAAAGDGDVAHLHRTVTLPGGQRETAGARHDLRLDPRRALAAVTGLQAATIGEAQPARGLCRTGDVVTII